MSTTASSHESSSRFVLMLTRLLFFACLCTTSAILGAEKPNVLLIAVDDLRPQLGAYGVEWMKTPHMDQLAASGTRFNHHYVNIAICIPSRVSLLTSLRSERTRQVYGRMRWQQVQGARPMGQTYRDAGYHAVSLGKIWHTQNEPSGDAWDVQWRPKAPQYAAENTPESNQPAPSPQKHRVGTPVTALNGLLPIAVLGLIESVS